MAEEPLQVSSLWAFDADLAEKIEEQEHKRLHARGWRLALLAFSTLGVVYGDIGTSPLYVYGAVFPEGAPADRNVIYGVFSTIFWTITSIVLVKYIIFTMQADDNGEGGIFALYALICRACNIRVGSKVHEADLSLSKYTTARQLDEDELGPDGYAYSQPKRRRRWREAVSAWMRQLFERSARSQTALLAVVLLAACMIISDGVLTPAISVVSAIEGIQFQTGISTGTVVGISIAILVLLFALQSFGTHRVSNIFSPIVLLWFTANAAIGAWNISKHGASAFQALSPHYMYYYWSGRSYEAWKGLGNILLCVTGAEALYADQGHFSVRSIRLSFAVIVYPSLLLTYLGQTSMIVSNPAAAATAYWSSMPSSLLWPMVVIATLAAIIASQALITGSFSIVQQAISMSAFPRLTIRHTSQHIMGQVYIPEVNWLLLICTIIVVVVFETSAKIGNAYGLAVVSVMLLDTSLLALVMITAWQWHLGVVAAFWLVFTFETGAFFSSNVQKVPEGAWLSLTIAAVLACISFVWHWGQTAKMELVRTGRTLLRDLFEEDTAPAVDAVKPGLGRASVASISTATSDKSAMPGVPALRLVSSKRPVARVPGIGVYFNELLIGVPPVLERFLQLMPAIHSIVIFLTVRVVPVPAVLPSERLLLRRLRFPGFYHVVARYGYMEPVDAGPDFVDGVVNEIFEYLHPMTGLADLTGAEGSVHRAVAELSAHGGRHFPGGPAAGGSSGLSTGEAGQASMDIELGLALPPMGLARPSLGLARPSLGRPSAVFVSAGAGPGGNLRRVSMQRGMVRVDGTESLTAITGRRLNKMMSVQLVRLSAATAAANDDTVQSRASSGRRRLPHGHTFNAGSSAITVAVPLSNEEAEGEGGGSAVVPVKASDWKPAPREPEPSPWVQMPSVVRRVRAQLMGQPEPQPAAAAAAVASARLHSAAGTPSRGDTAAAEAPLPADPTLSLPLPARRRPPLPPAAADSTMSLPLPAAQTRPGLAGVRHRSAASIAAASQSAAAQEQQPLIGAAAEPGQAAGAAEEEAPADESAAEKAARLGQRPGVGPTGATTLSKKDAAQLGQQLWQQLQAQRYLGQQAAALAEPLHEHEAAPDTEALQRAVGAVPSSPSGGAAPSIVTEVAMQADLPAATDAARRQLFDVTANASASQLADAYAAEREALLHARRHGVAYLVGRSALRAAPNSRWLKRFFVEGLYGTLAANARPTTASYNIDRQGLLQLGVDYELSS
ncbi:Potassium transporter family isoform C [Chlorella sorokiniana]|uniref:Potassium transporter n=1 Tax=Chlorella sorokiniana TaxID=3076 RepID=A0A2P6TVD2_CHLSO|nr:Potassium transporter family isoform B [Chlorella sorokiniana]PRW58026.1 Potassium transporter family isoform C [Chlorella sorokiniana]|eukprot:PRW58025.1 Potassium transporter family isoform B [Chlorella sorokiniana]